jgi:hypothetical protein
MPTLAPCGRVNETRSIAAHGESRVRPARADTLMLLAHGRESVAQEVAVKLITGLLASVFVVNPIAALGVASAAQADPTPRNPFDQQIVTTESRKARCIVEPGQVMCTGGFANAPRDPISPKNRCNTVWIEAAGGGLQWNASNMPSTGYAASRFDLVLTYDQVFHLKGWTVEPSSAGTRFTNDETGHGMFVRSEGVTSF